MPPIVRYDVVQSHASSLASCHRGNGLPSLVAKVKNRERTLAMWKHASRAPWVLWITLQAHADLCTCAV